METSDYEALLTDRSARFDQTDQTKQIARLKDAARNLETLHELAEAEAKAKAKAKADELEPELVNPGVTPDVRP